MGNTNKAWCNECFTANPMPKFCDCKVRDQDVVMTEVYPTTLTALPDIIRELYEKVDATPVPAEIPLHRSYLSSAFRDLDVALDIASQTSTPVIVPPSVDNQKLVEVIVSAEILDHNSIVAGITAPIPVNLVIEITRKRPGVPESIITSAIFDELPAVFTLDLDVQEGDMFWFGLSSGQSGFSAKNAAGTFGFIET